MNPNILELRHLRHLRRRQWLDIIKHELLSVRDEGTGRAAPATGQSP